MKFKKTSLALAIGIICCTSNAYAADNQSKAEKEKAKEKEIEVITVTSSQKGLIKALDLKRDADTLMDGITASELGAFPDANVADSLSHITGVSIDRTSGGEGKGVNVRGLGPQFSIVTINDRLMATDQSGREFAFDVLPSEVISEAWVYKSVKASQLEGSIGGAINLITARPFDNVGTHGSASFEGKYGEQADKFGFKMTGVGSHTFADDTMGVLFSALYSKAPTRTDSLSDNWWEAASSPNWTYDANGDGILGAADPQDNELIFPGTIAYTAREEDKERIALSGVFQYKPNDKVDIVFDALWTRLDTPSKGYTESYFFPDTAGSWTDPTFGGQTTALNPQGTLLTGITVQNLVPQLVTLEEHRVVDTFQAGLNASVAITQNSVLKGDIYISKAKREAGGKDRFVVSVPNVGRATESRLTLTDGGLPSINLKYLDNDANITSVSDLVGNGQFGPHFTKLEGVDIDDEVLGASLRHQIFFDIDVLDSIEYGVVYSKRTKERVQLDNSSSMTLFSNAPFSWADTGFDVVHPFPLDNFLDGVTGDFPREFASFDVEEAFNAIKSVEGNPNIINPATGEPYEIGYTDAFFPTFNSNASGTVAEETASLYLQGNFSVDFGDILLSGNLGLRYVETKTQSSGWDWPIERVDQSPTNIWSWIVVHGERTPVQFNNKYNELLPSVNLQVELYDDFVVRFSYAEVMARASIDQLSTQLEDISATWGGNTINRIGNPNLSPVTAEQADISIEWYYQKGSSVSAAVFAKDIKGFVQSGIDVYINDRENQPSYAVENPRPWDPQGYEEKSFTVLEPRNLDQAKILGYEFSLQHFFESGFGIVANYTYIDTESIVGGATIGVLAGVPDTTYSANFMYNDDLMSLSLAAYHTASFITSHWSPLNVPDENGYVNSRFKGTSDPSTWMTASATFYVFEGLETYIQVDNLLDEGWHGYNGQTNLPAAYSEWGRKLNVGVRYKF